MWIERSQSAGEIGCAFAMQLSLISGLGATRPTTLPNVAAANAREEVSTVAQDNHLARLDGGAGWIAAFSPDGKYILTSAGDRARVWELASFKPVLANIKASAEILYGGWSADSARFFVAGGDDIYLWDRKRGTEVSHIHQPSSVQPCNLSPDGSVIVTPDPDGAAVWDSQTGRSLRVLKMRGRMGWTSFSRDGRKLLTQMFIWKKNVPSSATPVEVHVWNPQTGDELIPSIRTDFAYRYARGADLSPDGRLLVVAGADHFTVFNVENGQTVCNNLAADYNLLDRSVTDVQFASDGKVVVEAININGIRLFDSDTGRGLTQWVGGTGAPATVTLDAKKVVVAGLSRHAGVWELSTGKRLQTFGPEFVWSVAVSPDGRIVAAGYLDRTDHRKGYADLWKMAE